MTDESPRKIDLTRDLDVLFAEWLMDNPRPNGETRSAQANTFALKIMDFCIELVDGIETVRLNFPDTTAEDVKKKVLAAYAATQVSAFLHETIENLSEEE